MTLGIVPIRWLYLLFAAILFVSAQQMLKRRRAAATSDSTTAGRWHHLGASYPDRESGVEVRYSVGRLPLGMGLMYGAGVVSALLGIGLWARSWARTC